MTALTTTMVYGEDEGNGDEHLEVLFFFSFIAFLSQTN